MAPLNHTLFAPTRVGHPWPDPSCCRGCACSNQWTCEQADCNGCDGCAAVLETLAEAKLPLLARDPVPGGWSAWERHCAGPLAVDGLTEPVYAVLSPGTDSSGVKISSDGLMLSHNVRLYFATRCSLDPSAYVAWALPGRTLSFTLDLDRAGCGCNVAPYREPRPHVPAGAPRHGFECCVRDGLGPSGLA